MDFIWRTMENASITSPETTIQSVLLSILLSFVLGQFLAWIYYLTHSGLSYSRSFVQSLILLTVIISLVMSTIAGSFVVAVGLMGALSMVRFRNVIKDTRDIAFLFCALVTGMATGSQRYSIAILGTVGLSIIIIYLHLSEFGSQQSNNAFLRFNLADHITKDHQVVAILKKFCGNFSLISSQDNAFGTPDVEYAYQLVIKNASKNEIMLSELQKVQGIRNISLTVQEQLLQM